MKRWLLGTLWAITGPLLASPAVPNAPPLMRDEAFKPLNLPLRQTVWRLAALREGEVLTLPAGTLAHAPSLSLRTAGSQLRAHSGCAPLRGRYVRRGIRLSMAVDAPRNPHRPDAKVACDGAQARQAAAFQQILGATVAYRVEGDRLSLLRADDTVLATFSATPR